MYINKIFFFIDLIILNKVKMTHYVNIVKIVLKIVIIKIKLFKIITIKNKNKQ